MFVEHILGLIYKLTRSHAARWQEGIEFQHKKLTQFESVLKRTFSLIFMKS